MSKARDLANAGTALTTVSATELGYLDGVTSAVQTQIDTKAASSTAATLTGTQTLTNKTLTSPAINTATATGAILVAPEERTTISATAATGTINFDAATQGVLYYTSNATANWTLNVRGSSGATLDSILTTGDAITVSFLVTNGTTAYRHSALTIDGSAVTPKWSGGTAPASGNASSIDAYSFTVIKTASETFTVLGAGPIKYA
jgi:trimeric autotransporter adhesin